MAKKKLRSEPTDFQSEQPGQPAEEANSTPVDQRADFTPRAEPSGESTSVTIPLKDGKINLEKMRDKTLETLRSALDSSEARVRLGLEWEKGAQRITEQAIAPLLGVLGLVEGLAVSMLAKVPREIGMQVMQYSDEEFAQIAPLAAEVLEESAPAWLRKFLLSDNAKIGQLAMVLFSVHQKKLAMLKEWKRQQAA
jgi:hypothetical protein